MKKYVYEKMSPDTFFEIITNEYLFLCAFLGAYLRYCKNSDGCATLDEFIDKHELMKCCDERIPWSLINQAHIFIRDRMDEKMSHSKHEHAFSRRQIRKFGYCGKCSVPMFPINGNMFFEETLSFIFSDMPSDVLRKAFAKYLYFHINSVTSYDCLENTDIIRQKIARDFIGFQYSLLNGNNAYRSVLSAMLNSEQFSVLQASMKQVRVKEE